MIRVAKAFPEHEQTLNGAGKPYQAGTAWRKFQVESQ